MFATIASAEEARLLRFPDIHNDNVVFVYGGDLWTVPVSGGQARKLTNDDGLELFPRFSPDGEKIAFTGQYDGDQNVFVMPAEGGEPKRLSFHPATRQTSERMGPESIVMDWTNDGSAILYRSREETHSIWEGKLCLVSPEGGYRQELPLPRGGFASFSADGSKIAYCPIFRDFRQWKRYKGGMAQDVWIYDLKQARSEKITDWIGTDNMPMWDHASGLIYFNSDRTGKLNLYSYNPETKETKQVTTYTDFDVRWPAMGPGAIIYENGGYLYVLDLATGTPRKLTITLASDRRLARSKWVKCGEDVQDADLSPDGNRAIFGAHGEIFTVPAKDGNTRNLTNTPGIHEKYAAISPDGRWIAYVSDASGEDELYVVEPGGNGTPQRLTTDGFCYKYGATWSPDSKKLVWSDKTATVRYIDIPTRKVTTITRSDRGDVRYQAWSPDSRYIAYAQNNQHQISQVYIYSLEDNRSRAVTPGEYDDHTPVFDPSGKYLYFLSEREFNPIFGNYEFNYILDKMTEIVAIVLSADEASPFAPKSDEVKPKEDGANDKKGKDDKADKKDDKPAVKPVKIDFDGIMSRQARFPVESGQYSSLAAVEGRVFYLSHPMGGAVGPVERTKTTLHVFDMEKREDNTFLEDVNGYVLTPDGKKMLVMSKGSHEIIDAGGDKGKLGEGRLNLDGMETWVDYDAEWRQMFEETWRLERDYFYDSLMHGVDWKAIHDKYAPLLDHVSHRFDLTYIQAEMVAELACSHTYVGDGDFFRPKPSQVGLLGIDWAIDSAAGLFRIGKILEGQNWIDSRRSPFTEPGIKAKAGDYVLALDGKPLSSAVDPYGLLVNTSDRTVTVKLATNPAGTDAWTVEVKPLSDEEDLRYYNWVLWNKHYVDSISGGKIGYVHIPDMGGGGLVEFNRQFFPQIRKEGMVIDVRYNGGGFVSQLIIERLRRVLGGMGISRNFAAPSTYPGTVFYGHLACLLNEHSCSDGDIFPYYFREYGLGPLIGKRTWGGVVGIRGHRPLLDGGFVTTPEFAKYEFDRSWSKMENHGVDPDIDVDNLPEDLYRGKDAQMDRAVQEILKKIKEEPRVIPLPPPAPPDKR
ncbi:MAG: S41 family peptidase [Candidatus Zixiibacteriota bacterium]